MKEIIWVFGVGAIGKKTQMLQAANVQYPSLIRRTLGIARERVIIPVIVAGKHPDRTGLIRQIYQCDIDALFLIHGQDEDLKDKALDEFCSPKAPRCLYIWTTEARFNERTRKRKKKRTWTYQVALQHREKWLPLLPRYFKETIIIDT